MCKTITFLTLLLKQIGEQFPTQSTECGEVYTICRPINLTTFLLLRLNDAGIFMPVAMSDRCLYFPLPNSWYLHGFWLPISLNIFLLDANQI